MLHTIFGHNLYIKEFEDLGKFESYRTVFTKQLVNMGHVYIDDSIHRKNIQKRGNTVSSVSPYSEFQNLFGHSLLEKVLEPVIIEARQLMFKNMEIKKVSLYRSWHNINYKNSYVVSHSHSKITEKYPDKRIQVCMLYLEAPEGSGKLAIIDDDTNDLSCNEFDQNKVHYIPVKPNMLICHDSGVYHAVSEHLSDERRICVVFEYILE